MLDEENIVYCRIAETIDFSSWASCEEKLCEVRFHNTGAIEDLK